MTLGYIGLGKMGFNMVERLLRKGHSVFVFDKDMKAVEEILSKNAKPCASLKEMASELTTPRTFWLMVPHGAVDPVLKELTLLLNKGDVVIDGGNSYFKDSMRRSRELEEKGIGFLDAGVSGGPGGAREGACLMVGGKKELYEKYETLFKDVAALDGYGYMGRSGAGHFVKMVHNGIEYGMMQAIAEGFEIMKKSDFNLNLSKVADVYNHQSVITSRLVGWLKDAFEEYGEDLEKISGTVGHTGEGSWTVEIAKELGVPAPVIEDALNFRIKSAKNPSYAGKILSALRNQFGGHDVK